jgi:hypothetical protein
MAHLQGRHLDLDQDSAKGTGAVLKPKPVSEPISSSAVNILTFIAVLRTIAITFEDICGFEKIRYNFGELFSPEV